MKNPQNVELEAAKFLHKLIQDSRDEPTKLATKLYVILQHMRSSGKENSMPYQVISRAMETVIKENNLDIESLMSSRLPLATGSQIGDSASSQLAGSSQQVGSDKDSKPSFSGNEMETLDTYVSTRVLTGPTSGGSDVYQGSAANARGSYKSSESANKMQFGNSSFDSAVKTCKDRSMEVFPSIPSGDQSSGKSISGKTSDHGSSSMVTNANKGCSPSSLSDTNVLRTNASMDIGKFPICQASSPGRPFNDQQLKQLRAQCLVFLAFRNGMMPKPLHLEIALGNIYTKEDGSRRDPVDRKRKEQLVNDPSSAPQIPRSLEKADSSTGHPSILNSYSSKEVDFAKLSEVKSSRPAIPAEIELDRKSLVARGKINAEVLTHEAKELHIFAKLEPHDSSTREIINHNHENDLGISHQPKNIAATVMDLSEQSKLEESSGSGNGFPNDIHKVPFQTKFVMNDALLQKMDDGENYTQNTVDSNSLGKLYSDKKLPSIPLNDPWKPVVGITGQNYPAIPIKYSNIMLKNVSQVSGADLEGDYPAISTERQSSPKHTTIERWILERQKRKALTEQNLAHKQQKTEQRISSCADKLKQIVSASEDISAKTKSVIELKKLQLLELQRHLRSDILSDFFKPIASEMDRLKSVKKHRIGRRSKQIERFEQRMKEERQKRIRERQKGFFSDLEVHRERLDDGFKIKRERWKGLNRYVREFHKKKERLHREKIDRIQREKINLLKINDVEGYLRMVQDAKSDRVKQLLKETEKYLQKLGSKLKDAKAISRHFETDMEESKVVAEENEDSVENEDEAKHYLESNEKYYTMAHSVKENILEQPTGLIGGKLREYQMNGLRWLVSLYNNHLNGILADEMGLGKTVQVISLICYLMENKNDRGPFLVVVPSSVLPGWEAEIKFWAPNIHRIIYSGPPEERRRLFKEHIVHQKFNVLLTTYEYLMNKHDRPKLSKIQWHYVIIDEGHRIKNASCKLNADLKHYRSNHRLLLTGTPLQNNLEELWALLNFLLPNIFNSSDDFSQWFNKPFESNGDNSLDEALLSEEENLLIINRLHQVLRPFVLRRLKHKVENQLPEKIERLIRCEASSYQKLLMKRVEDNLGAIGTSKARSVHNSVMELRNICNHPYLSQLHVEEVHDLIPKHYLPHVVRLCGKLEMLDRLLPKLKATDHRVLFFSTMTRLLDVMEDYLCWKQYKYLRLDGHTSGGDRGGLIERFNQPDSPYFIFLLSIRAGGVGVNLQAADTVIIFDTDWNPQVDLQAQARAHRIGQKKDVLVLRLETVQTVEEQVRASAEHKLGVANQSITAGFFDNNTSAEDRREYLESLLRENKKEEVAPVLDDDSLNDIIARREEEIDIFESVDKQRRDEEMAAWKNMFDEKLSDKSIEIPPLPSRLLTEDDLKSFYEVMKISDTPTPVVLPNAGVKRKSGYLGGLDTKQYGRGKRAREVRSYEEQMTEEEFERLCAVESPESPILKKEVTGKTTAVVAGNLAVVEGGTQAPALPTQLPQHSTVEPTALQNKEATAADVATSTPPSKRGRGRPKRAVVEHSSPVPSLPPGFEEPEVVPKVETTTVGPSLDSLPSTTYVRSITGSMQELDIPVTTDSGPAIIPLSVTPTSQTGRGRVRGRKSQTGGEPPASRRRGKVQAVTLQPVPLTVSQSVTDKPLIGEFASSSSVAKSAGSITISGNKFLKEVTNELNPALPASVVPSALVSPVSVVPSASDQSAVDVSPQLGVETDPAMASDQAFIASVAVESVNKPDPGIATALGPQASAPLPSGVLASQSVIPPSPLIVQGRRRGQGRERGRGRGLNAQSPEETPPPQRRRRRQEPVVSMIPGAAGHDSASSEPPQKRTRVSVGMDTVIGEAGQELKKASQYAALDVKCPSALHVSKGKGTAEEKFADAPQDQTKNAKGVKDHANVVLALSFNSSDIVQSVLTSAPAVKALSVISESGNQFSTESGEPNNKNVPDDKDSCGSLISVPVMFGVDDIQGPSEDPQSLLIINRDSIEMEKDQGVNRSTVVLAATSEAVPLVSENDEVDCQNEDGKISVSKKSTNTDEHLASDSLLKQPTYNVSSNSIPKLCDSKDTLVAPEESQSLPVLSRISVETGKEQVLNSASALVSMPLPGESDNSESHFVKEEDKITESFESPNLDESLVSIGNTSEKMKNTNNESGEVQTNEHGNNTTTAEADVSKSELHVDNSAVVTCTGSFTEPTSVSPDALISSASGNVEVEFQGAMAGSSMTRMVSVAGHDSVVASTLKAEVQDMADSSVEQVPKDSLLKGATDGVVTRQGVVNDTSVAASSDSITDPVTVASVDPASSPQVSAQDTEDPSAEQVRKDTDIRSNELDNSPQGQQDASEQQVSKATCPSPGDSEPHEDPSDGVLNTVFEVLEDEHTKESAVAPEVFILATEAACHTLVDSAAAPEDLSVNPIFIDTSEKLPTEKRPEEENAAPLEEVSILTTEQVLHLNSSSDVAVNTTSSDIANEHPVDKPAAVEVSILTTEQVLHANSLSDVAVKMAKSDIANEQLEEKPAAVEVFIHSNSSSDVAVKMARSDIANEQLEEKPSAVEVSIHPNSSSDVAVNTASCDIVSEHPEEKPVAVEVGISATEHVLHLNSLSDVAMNTMSSDIVNEQPEEEPASVEVSISTTEHLHPNSLSDVAVHTTSSDITNDHPEEKPTAVEVSISTIEQGSHPNSSSDVAAVNTANSDIANEYLEEKPAAFDVYNSTTGLLKVNGLDSTPEESTLSVALEEESLVSSETAGNVD